ncbi:cupin domain-containing protein [Rhodococcus sp. ABRD24]|uniref:cupin domain-containing protein n=1 Tax=Rhodococcus sp. ABRD24 TaxID=2507582 RepID=UPI0013F155DC|nr:cupin domain-containing protein [Rhodococcus sp. ABRD24]
MSQSTTQRPAVTDYKVRPTVNFTAAELEASHIARFHELIEDVEVFSDIKSAVGRRKHFHPLSPRGHLGPAKITTPHNFHMSYVEVPPGSSSFLHAHDAVEVFIPIHGKIAFIFNDGGEEEIVLDPLDVFSVPPHMIRNFKNIGTTNALFLVIYDGDDVLNKIYVDQETHDKFAREAAER